MNEIKDTAKGGAGKKLSEIRVFQAAKWYWPEVGGIETVAKVITGAIADKAEIEILVCSGNRGRVIEKTEEGAYIYRAKTSFKICSTPISFDYIRAFARMSKKADLIQMHAPFPLSDLALFLCGGRKKQKKVMWYHSDVVKQRKLMLFYKPLLKWTLKKMDRIYIASRSIAEQSEYLAPYSDKIEVVPFGISVGQYEKAERSPILTGMLNDSQNVKLLFVGRLVYYKGIDVLISAMKNVTNAELFVVGSGELDEQLRMLVKELNIENKIHFMGRVDTQTLLAAFADCDIFILPSVSRAECFGLVQLEAMVYGKPVINTALPTAVPEISLHGETGITVPPGDKITLAGAIQSLTDDKDLRVKYGENAKERCKKYSLADMEKRLLDSYADLMKRG